MTESIERSEAMRQEAIALLITDRNAIDAQLAKLGYSGETVTEKKSRTVKCGKCQGEGHTARTCSVIPSA